MVVTRVVKRKMDKDYKLQPVLPTALHFILKMKIIEVFQSDYVSLLREDFTPLPTTSKMKNIFFYTDKR